MRKQPEVTERTRAALRDAFWELYAGRPAADGAPAREPMPIERISVRQITDRAGYNRATFYLYFHDVYDLLAQVEEGLIADAREVVEHRLMPGPGLDFSQHMGLIARLAQEGAPYLGALLGPHGDPAFVARFKQVLRPVVARFLVTSPELDERGRDLMEEFYLAGLLALIARWLDEYEDMPVERLLGLVTAQLLPSPATAPATAS